MAAVYKYILDFKANTEKFSQEVKGVGGMMKAAAVTAGALFAADKILDAAKAVGEYAKEISATSNAVKQLTGLQGNAANQMTGQVTALSKAYGTDVNEALKASNVMMKSFKDSSREAFDVLNVGLSGAANANGDLLDQIKEYSPHFAEAGLSAQQMIAIMNAGGKEGVFSDKAADAVKEGSIRLREMTQSTKDAINGLGLSSDQIQKSISNGSMSMFEVMQLVSNKLNEFPQQSPQVGAALADIFGGPGEDAVNFIRTLGDLDTSMEGLMAGATEAQKAQMKYSQSLAEFHTVGAAVFGGVGEMMTKLKTVGMNAANGIIKGVVSVINYFIDLYNESGVIRGVFQAVGFAVKTVFGYIGEQLKQLLNYFKGIGKVLKAVFTGDFKSIGGIIEDTFNNAKTIATDFGAKVGENFSKGVENTLNPRQKIKLISLDAADTVEAGTKAGKDYAKGIQQGVNTTGVKLPARDLTPAAAMTTAAVTVTGAKGIDETSTALANMSPILEKLDGQAKNLQQGLKEVADVSIDLGGLAKDGFVELGKGIGDMLSGTASAGDVFGSLMGIVSNFMSTLGESMIAAGTAGIAAEKLFLNPYLSVAAGVALIALSSVVASKLQGGVKMAKGGLLYGPTSVIAGEYPGARSNPEVIAPLNKLKNYIGERGVAQSIQVEVIGNISGDNIRLAQKRADRKRNQFN